MNTKTPELREFAEIPNSKEATKLHLLSMITCALFGMIVGIALVASGIISTDPPCSAQPFCTEHKGK